MAVNYPENIWINRRTLPVINLLADGMYPLGPEISR